MSSLFRFSVASAALLVLSSAACSRRSVTLTADGPPAIPREMRGIWVATVRNIDWPSRDTLSAERQREELLDLFDRAVAAGFNTVVFQVRPAADAVYRSDLEPWSVLLSGRQGTDPGYDPLEFAVEQAHARGLELHAWINPFRAGMNVADTAALAPTHLWNTRRDLVRVYGSMLWLDPGEADAREHSLRVVNDIVRRYDIDGIHMDDYFYPYPVRDSVKGGNLAFPDSVSYAASYAKTGSAIAVDDWRRENIDRFVERLYRSAHEIKPAIKVGISPFGIWRPGNPSSVAGFDAYASIYADARKWLQSGWVDYFVPQLYWAISAPQQSFPALLDWWIGEDTLHRHVWPGLATYRSAALTNGFSRTEIAEQVKLIRARSVAPGHIMFNTTTTLKRDNGVLRTLEPLFAERALVPAFSWLDDTPPAAPSITVTGRTVAISSAEKPRFWAVQWLSRGGLFRRARWTTRVVSGDSTTVTLPADPARVFVSAVDHAGNVSRRGATQTVAMPRIIPGEQWRASPPLGHAADASRRNKASGDSLAFRDVTVTVLGTSIDSTSTPPADVVRLRLSRGTTSEERSAREGSAFNWNGYHVAVVAVYGSGELGAGLTALEVATVASLPPDVAASTTAGGADLRLRIPHNITHVTLHHTGSPEPLRPEEDPVAKLRGLQSWGAAERNWWDVPYHYLLDLKGNIYAGRDWHYMGETNTAYDPGGHFLISVIGNYERQEPTPAQLAAIADLMAWAVREFNLPLERIGGHYNYATTTCPGQHLRKYLEDGTLVRMVRERLK